MVTKEEAQLKIKELVDRFEEQQHSYYRPGYSETSTRRDFIDPFFMALGWDVANTQGYAETYREVIHEDRVMAHRNRKGRAKFPDYSFRLSGGKRLFFVEAKKPGVVIKNEMTPAIQVRTYGWSAGLPISIITDFAEFAVYDCTKKPRAKDKPATARIKYLTYRDYLDEFDFIWNTFSREKVLKGSFDRFVQNDRKGTSTVDVDFLNLLTSWREQLATSIGQRHPGMGEEEITFAVQEIINRIIFMRIAEDRDVERYGNLKEVIQRGDYYRNLLDVFRVANEKYNAEFFSLGKHDVTHTLKIDNKTIRSIINDLYYPESTYAFDVIPVEIMGTAYEQFLGKCIRFTSAHRVKIEDKPEVRKAGGVYYTPQYIVDYIIRSTVKGIVDGKDPIDLCKLKIIDPACGSGSFLIGAYQYLLDYHRDYYLAHSRMSRNRRDCPLTPDGYLTSSEKKRILQNSIFGVDIDRNAVQVTKMALLLKCMEGETIASVENQLRLFHEPILPALHNNIKTGNTLVDTDYYDEEWDDESYARVKPFNWKSEFPGVHAQGGFDAVIGNPPYVLFQNLETRESFDYVKRKYKSARYKIDSYQLFIEASINMMKERGLLGFITPNTFLKNIHAEPLRRLMLDHSAIDELVMFNYPVFSASVDTCIVVLSKYKASDQWTVTVKQVDAVFKPEKRGEIAQRSFGSNARADFNVSIRGNDEAILQKMIAASVPLGTFCDAYFGIQTYDRKQHVSDRKLNKYYEPVIDGMNVHHYWLKGHSEYVQFVPAAIKSGGKEAVYRQQRICIRQIGTTPIAAIVPADIFTLNTIYNVYRRPGAKADLRYLLAVINSTAGKFYWSRMSSDEKRTFPKIKKEAILSIPVPRIGSGAEAAHDEIVKNVDKLMKLYEEHHSGRLTGPPHQQLRAKIKHCEQRIDTLVYELFGLDAEDVAEICKAMGSAMQPKEEVGA